MYTATAGKSISFLVGQIDIEGALDGIFSWGGVDRTPENFPLRQTESSEVLRCWSWQIGVVGVREMGVVEVDP